MKLWEVIKELTEDPTKKFKSKDGWFIRFTEESSLEWVDNKDVSYGMFKVKQNFLETEDWQLVKQPVTWQKAIQEWADGKKVSYSYMGYDKRFPFEDSNTMMSIEKVKNAEWYVED